MVQQLSQRQSKNNSYTVVGSRRSPQWAIEMLTEVVNRMEYLGYIGRSGDCRQGIDTCLNLGLNDITNGELYVPNRRHKGFSDGRHVIAVDELPNCDEAMKLAEKVHPAWDRCDEYARSLHGRNPYQVLGRNLDDPSLCVFTWAPPKINRRSPDRQEGSHHVSGGTATAVAVALMYGVPVWNINNPQHRDLIERFLVGEKVRLFTKRINLV